MKQTQRKDKACSPVSLGNVSVVSCWLKWILGRSITLPSLCQFKGMGRKPLSWLGASRGHEKNFGEWEGGRVEVGRAAVMLGEERCQPQSQLCCSQTFGTLLAGHSLTHRMTICVSVLSFASLHRETHEKQMPSLFLTFGAVCPWARWHKRSCLQKYVCWASISAVSELLCHTASF